MSYEPKPYPKMKYHATEQPRTVKDEKAEAELEGEWHDSPADVNKPKPEPSKVILSELPQKNGDSLTVVEPAEEAEAEAEGVVPAEVPAVKARTKSK